ncbi:ADP-ribose pyrophosphatase [Actinorhabdospora filicis]|uniref:ADP-ribose pyrophosphatase n=1 Tax=Actinorhabdospora filicis TaxID=1785913 RepID=A0A9W6WAS2_9ACTN|nr:NUDIX hydrolase [Actinorhabdospora filicis]GLZ79313.1 ADP-ribose pyrophosphatase [Actinorhabdospora filicis]
MTHQYEVLGSVERFAGPMFSVVTDEVAMPGGVTASRDYMRHIGAVGVVALDDDDRVLLVHQYRHPVRAFLWELPAGLLDVAGEAPELTAARELAEEADLTASSYTHLTDALVSPGCSNERIRLYLARGLAPVPDAERHVREHEEAEMTTRWWNLDEAVAAVLDGRIANAACQIGVLAAAALQKR